jgi:SAM-dependent methyltransferase
VTLRSLLGVIVGAVVAGWWVSLARRPRGLAGRIQLSSMSAAHAPVTDWALAQLAIPSRGRILDVGCGGGRTIGRLALLAPHARVDGVDYSPTSVEASRRRNAALVESGRSAIRVASVAALPFPDLTFDLVTGVETHYYWPDLRENLREVLRVIKPGGELALIAETHKGGPLVWLYWLGMQLVRGAFLTAAEHEAALRDAGFADVTVTIGSNRTWLLARGRRPQPVGAATVSRPASLST